MIINEFLINEFFAFQNCGIFFFERGMSRKIAFFKPFFVTFCFLARRFHFWNNLTMSDPPKKVRALDIKDFTRPVTAVEQELSELPRNDRSRTVYTAEEIVKTDFAARGNKSSLELQNTYWQNCSHVRLVKRILSEIGNHCSRFLRKMTFTVHEIY